MPDPAIQPLGRDQLSGLALMPRLTARLPHRPLVCLPRRAPTRSLQPRRACCQKCDTSQVLLPAWAVPQARWRRGDRLSAAGQRCGCWAPRDRGSAWSPAGHGTGLAAGVRGPRRNDQPLGAVMGARHRRLLTAPRPAGSPFSDAVEALRHHRQGMPLAARGRARAAAALGSR